ncbi:hypothetical protein [Jidongwangia harbinensis]|uniref:hypothetical protein n=1 Tax=Jidongwangia harbinensis TaxID=2878561 RepID=UPI001CDA498C|nr:hypothetical protein [Jidongwangia harbinensis]MCA2217773.1 hypothetical protein [Jidongwangia harbinensis]
MEAEALGRWLDRLTFADLGTDEVTARIIDAVVEWGEAQRWRVYRRAPSVVTLPPPLERQHSVLDVACARADGPPLAVEVDHTDRRRTVDKLLAEAEAGRVAIWVRWGTGPFRPPPAPVAMVPFEVTRRPGRRYARTHDRPPPAHSTGIGRAEEMPIPFGDQA